MLPVGFLVFSDELAPYRILDVDELLSRIRRCCCDGS